jgi:hypothetical protein
LVEEADAGATGVDRPGEKPLHDDGPETPVQGWRRPLTRTARAYRGLAGMAPECSRGRRGQSRY